MEQGTILRLNKVKKEKFLDQRNLEIIKMLSEGMSSKEIAEVFLISSRTVEAIVGSLCAINECKNRTHLVSKFIKGGQLG